jgi:hypothetical protein
MARTAKQVIDQAVAENRRWETLCFIGACLAVAVSGSFFMIAVVKQEPLGMDRLLGSGSIISLLFFPSLYFGRQYHRTSQAIRLAEIALSMSKNSTEAVEVIRNVLPAISQKTPSLGTGGGT